MSERNTPSVLAVVGLKAKKQKKTTFQHLRTGMWLSPQKLAQGRYCILPTHVLLVMLAHGMRSMRQFKEVTSRLRFFVPMSFGQLNTWWKQVSPEATTIQRQSLQHLMHVFLKFLCSAWSLLSKVLAFTCAILARISTSDWDCDNAASYGMPSGLDDEQHRDPLLNCAVPGALAARSLFEWPWQNLRRSRTSKKRWWQTQIHGIVFHNGYGYGSGYVRAYKQNNQITYKSVGLF
jgi:hypothetical protein